MSKRYRSHRAHQILSIVKVADAAAIARAKSLDGHKTLSYHFRYTAFQISRCPGYEHLDQARLSEEIIYMPSPGVSSAPQYLYMAIHPLAAARPPGRAGISIASGGKIDLTQGPYTDLLRLFQREDDGVDSQLITAISHMNPFPIIAI